jgi:hypothetical protein
VKPRRIPIQALALPLLYLVGCPEPQPGVELGTYRVIATRSGGTCGAWREPAQYSFNVRLTIRSGVLRWAQTSGSPIDGTLDARASSFHVTLQDYAQLAAPNRAREYLGCAMVRQDVVDGTFQGTLPDPAAADAAASMPPFRGTYSTSFAPAPGSDCRPYIGALEQQWAALPCSTTYTLEGARM